MERKRKTWGHIGRTSKLKSKSSETQNTTIISTEYKSSQAKESTSTLHGKNLSNGKNRKVSTIQKSSRVNATLRKRKRISFIEDETDESNVSEEESETESEKECQWGRKS